MPPNLALILCIAFVLFLLWLERKQSPNVTRALWIPTIWMLYISSKPLAVWFSSTIVDPEAGSPLDRTFLLILMSIAIWILVQRRFDWSSAMKENPWLMVLIIFMLISIFWSDMPYTSFKRWIRELQAVLMAFVVLSEPSIRQAMESIFRRTIYILIPFSLLLIKYFPDLGVFYTRWEGAKMWVGVTTHKNSLGRLCLTATFFLIWSLIRRWQKKNAPVWKYQTYIEIFILTITFLLFRGMKGEMYSATGIISLGFGLLFYIGLNILKKSRINLGIGTLKTIVASFIIFGIVIFFVGGSYLGMVAKAAGRNSTLTDRTYIWAILVPTAMQKPILGAGFGGFWTQKMRTEFIPEAHNGYLDILLNTGFVGILLLSIFLLSVCKKAHRELSHNFDWGALIICYIIMTVVHNITESSLNSFATHLTAVILFLSVTSLRIPSHRQKL